MVRRVGRSGGRPSQVDGSPFYPRARVSPQRRRESARYGHWIAVTAVAVRVPPIFIIQGTGIGESVKVLVIAGLLFLVRYIMSFTVFARGASRAIAVLAAFGGVALHLIWLWGQLDQLVHQVVGCSLELACYLRVIIMTLRDDKRFIAPLIRSRVKRQKSSTPSSPKAGRRCGTESRHNSRAERPCVDASITAQGSRP